MAKLPHSWKLSSDEIEFARARDAYQRAYYVSPDSADTANALTRLTTARDKLPASHPWLRPKHGLRA